MSLPAIADLRRALDGAVIDVAARPSIAPLFTRVADVNDVVVLEPRGRPGVTPARRFAGGRTLPRSC